MYGFHYYITIVQSALELGFIYALVALALFNILQYFKHWRIFRPMDVLHWDVPSVHR